ncbi:MAG TPA: ABC transporter [Candidatus Limiplasma sp.]|mgnify:CR=1 FL=1|nr:ABC transporter [Candidatus Limiplasma sp.]HPS80446.1 ABC transporter [Candidatus Limiplasma sp.]
MKGLFCKEWNHLFKTMTGYVFIALYLALSGAVFTLTCLLAQSGDIKSYFSVFNTVSVLLFPILTMGLFSEERKQKTDELLLTAPVTLTSVVMGKFLATLSVFLLPMLVTLCYPAVLYLFGVRALAVTVGNYLGLLLLASACIALGEFLSLLTDSQFVAAMTTYAVFGLLLLAGSATSMVSNPTLQAALAFLAITTHCQGFAYGVFDLMEAVYFLSVTALFLFLSVYMLERRRLS